MTASTGCPTSIQVHSQVGQPNAKTNKTEHLPTQVTGFRDLPHATPFKNLFINHYYQIVRGIWSANSEALNINSICDSHLDDSLDGLSNFKPTLGRVCQRQKRRNTFQPKRNNVAVVFGGHHRTVHPATFRQVGQRQPLVQNGGSKRELDVAPTDFFCEVRDGATDYLGEGGGGGVATGYGERKQLGVTATFVIKQRTSHSRWNGGGLGFGDNIRVFKQASVVFAFFLSF